MEFPDHDRSAFRDEAGDISYDRGRLISVMQNHRDESRAGVEAFRVECGSVCGDALDLADAELRLPMF
jgi:hypothetical protein